MIRWGKGETGKLLINRHGHGDLHHCGDYPYCGWKMNCYLKHGDRFLHRHSSSLCHWNYQMQQ